ncbi:MAG: lactate utilization protein B [Myxococcota bacterium]|nr:lactate utilization protein B [Myxococcota bacterium]
MSSSDSLGHPERAAIFGKNAERVGWHEGALWSVRAKRDAAAAGVEGWEELRAAAAQIKSHTQSRLPAYREQFEDRATQLGVHVHWAADAAEHNATVLGLLRERSIARVVKSKSMLTEECGLNPHLEAHGLEVVDTDLGERIVQLRNEPPSHIVMPAIHLKREEVGELFHRELGAEAGLSDPQALVELARSDLRGRFLAAEAGITGVNFGVAETGGFVVVTNEGNADLGTALPKLHIASMGIEKVIPRERDLGVFLRLLARSATGQPISAYTSHFHGPPADGELHLVLVDNGRSNLLARGSLRRSLACIRCGACLNTCPVYRRSGGHSYGAPVAGPIGSVLAAASDPARHASLPHACSLCGSCADVCPVKIDLPKQLLELRADARVRAELSSSKRCASRLASWLLRRPGFFDFVMRGVRPLLRRLPEAWSGRDAWTRHRDLPDIPVESFRQIWKRRQANSMGKDQKGEIR